MHTITYLTKLLKGFWSLLVGLWVTLKYFFKKAVTMQYPDERWALPEGYRGLIRLIPDKCTSCLICAKNCPNHCIEIKFDLPAGRHGLDENKRRKLKEYNLDFAKCLFCGICVETCPFAALTYSPEYELSEYEKEKFVYNLVK